jgi:hypothetical protein
VESEWTVETLRQFLQKQLDDQRSLLDERYATQTKALDAAFKAAEQAVQTALASAEKAVTKAETAAERRFESVNEFRQTLTDQASTFITRAEAEVRFTAIAEKIDAAVERVDKTEGRADRDEGRSTGLNAGWVYLLAAIGAMGTLFTIYVIVQGG